MREEIKKAIKEIRAWQEQNDWKDNESERNERLMTRWTSCFVLLLILSFVPMFVISNPVIVILVTGVIAVTAFGCMGKAIDIEREERNGFWL